MFRKYTVPLHRDDGSGPPGRSPEPKERSCTLGAISGIMHRRQGAGECFNGRCFWCSDLIIICKPGFVSMVDAIRGMIAIFAAHSSAVSRDGGSRTV